MTSLHTMSPGEQPYEQVGKLADGRQVLLTTRFGPVAREDGEHTQLTLLVFDAGGAVLSSDWRVLGVTAELSDQAINEASRLLLDPFGRLTPSPILIQPVPVKLLGGPRPPLALTCDQDPSLSVVLPGDEGFFIPDWPFAAD